MEPVGLAVGIISLAGVFETAIHCFEYVHDGQNFSVQLQTSSLKLSDAQIRLSRWGKAVGLEAELTKDKAALNKHFNGSNLQDARKRVNHIVQLFEEAKEQSATYDTQAQSSTKDTDERDPKISAVSLAMRRVSITRLKQSTTSKKVQWAVRKNRFNGLIEHITVLVKHLEELFPAAAGEREALAAEEAKELAPNKIVLQTLLRELGTAKQEVQDKLLMDALEARRQTERTAPTVTSTFGNNNSGLQANQIKGGSFNWGAKSS
ncbi:hypothetical protein LTR85_008174 [Meristemomyces frigidus]|nr:hypothetical protein LTR85_008174 [Meristemomyces frigidus]